MGVGIVIDMLHEAHPLVSLAIANANSIGTYTSSLSEFHPIVNRCPGDMHMLLVSALPKESQVPLLD
jgi:hypothetical protein